MLVSAQGSISKCQEKQGKKSRTKVLLFDESVDSHIGNKFVYTENVSHIAALFNPELSDQVL